MYIHTKHCMHRQFLTVVNTVLVPVAQPDGAMSIMPCFHNYHQPLAVPRGPVWRPGQTTDEVRRSLAWYLRGQGTEPWRAKSEFHSHKAPASQERKKKLKKISRPNPTHW